MKKHAITSLLVAVLLFSTTLLNAAINTDYPIEEEFQDDGTRYTILVVRKVSEQQATEDAIYISSFLNLPVFVVQKDQTYSVYVGNFIHQQEVPNLMVQLRMSGYRRLSYKKKNWAPEQESAQFNQQYLSAYETPPNTEESQLKEDAVKIIGEQPDAQPDLWVSVPDHPVFENELRQGWLFLSLNHLEQACDHFAELRKSELIKMKATYGLATCYHKTNQPERSVPLYTELLINNQGIEYYIIEFLDDLNALGRTEEAQHYQNLFESLTKNYWTSEQYLLSFREKVLQTIHENDAGKMFALLESHERLLNRCEAIGSFYGGANFLKRVGHTHQAKQYYLKLMEKCPEKWHLKLGLIYSLSSLSSTKENQIRISQEMQQTNAPASYQKRLNSLLFELELNKAYALPKYTQTAYEQFQSLNQRYPNRPQILNQLGWWHYQHEEFDQALAFFKHSQDIRATDEANKGILYSLLRLGKNEEVRQQAGSQPVEDIQLNLLKDQLRELEVNDPRVDELTQQILVLAPDDLPTKTTRAWHLYEVQKYSESRDAFAALRQQQPNDVSFLKGHVYSLIQLGDADQTEAILSEEQPQDEDLEQVAAGIYMDKAIFNYETKHYSAALNYTNKYLALEPNNQDALALRSWIHFHLNEKSKAVSDLESVWQDNPSHEHTKSLLFLYRSQYQDSPTDTSYQEFLAQLQGSYNRDWNTLAANEFASINHPVRAAQVSDAPNTSYYNANSPHAHLAFGLRRKSGDKGTSQLQQVGAYLGADIYSNYGKQWRLQLGWETLDAGTLPQSPFIGRAFLSEETNQPKQTPDTKLSAKRIWLQHLSETGFLKSATLGTTAINSIISTQPVFELEGSFQTNLLEQRIGPYWNIHQRLLDDTLLSYLGQHDPYSEQEWGRAMKTGVTLGNQWTLTTPYWLSANVSGDYYWGKHLWENWSIEGNASLGKTDIYDTHLRSLGIYTNLQHYDRNSNFFTFGHGGYYSPQLLMGAGPFAAWEARRQNIQFWWKAETSIGAFWELADSAPLYPVDQQAPGEYDSDSGMGIGARIKVQYRKLWNSYFETSGLLEWRKAPDYDEARAQATFRIYFEPRNALTTFEVLDRIELP